jgi:CRP-like cAMP-binding protein
MRAESSNTDFTLPLYREGQARDGSDAHRANADAGPQVRNRLLRKLPPGELQRLMARAERIELHPRQILHHWNMPMRDVYFVEQGLVSVSVKISREQAVEGWLIGSEGMTGIPVLLGDHENPPYRRVVQVGGSALRLAADDLQAAVRELQTVRALLLRYAQFVLCQSSQWGACNAHHSLKQRMGRWLLAASDGVESHRLPVTHQLLARLLGVRRASVSECLNALEAEGVIRNTRSLIEIARPDALVAMSCDCYRVVQRDYRRLLEPRSLRTPAAALG